MLAKFEVVIFSYFDLGAFGAQKFTGSCDPSHTRFRNFYRGHIRTDPGSMIAKYDIHIFSHFGAISI